MKTDSYTAVKGEEADGISEKESKKDRSKMRERERDIESIED